MLKNPGRVFGSLAIIAAVLLIASIALGSSGTIEGDPDTGQQIANVTFPLFFLTIAVGVALGIFYLVKRRGSR